MEPLKLWGPDAPSWQFPNELGGAWLRASDGAQAETVRLASVDVLLIAPTNPNGPVHEPSEM